MDDKRIQGPHPQHPVLHSDEKKTAPNPKKSVKSHFSKDYPSQTREKPIDERQISSTSSTDSLISTSSSELNDSVGSSLSIDSGVESSKENSSLLTPENEQRLRNLSSRSTSTLGSLNMFLSAHKNLTELKDYLNDPSQTNEEKRNFLQKTTGLFSHMARKSDGTSTQSALFAIEEMTRMLNILADVNKNDADLEKNLKELLDSSAPCFEAKVSNAQEKFASLLDINGIDNNNMIDVKNILDPTQDHSKILSDKLKKFMEDHQNDSNAMNFEGLAKPEAFYDWVMEEDMLVGFNADDGEITPKKINDFIDFMIDLDTMAERKS